MWSEIKRKLFHLTALLYVVGIIYLPRRLYVGILGVALASVLVVESVRLKNLGVNAWFSRHFGGLLREQEFSHMSGVPWMLAGIGLTAAMVRPLPLAVTAMLYLILGDTVASLVGMRVGGPHWPGSDKRLAGSAACLVACLVVGVIVLRPDYGWNGVLIGALTATVLEWAPIPVDDNFSIPVGSALALCLVYHVIPFAWLWE